MRDRFFFLTWIAVTILGAASVFGQGTVRRAEPVNPSGVPALPAAPVTPGYVAAPSGALERPILVDPNKKLAPGDQVTIEIVEDREGPFSRVITATGELDVPPLDRVRVVGMTASAAAAEIKRQLLKDYYHKVTVKVSIDRVSSAPAGKVQVTGAVRSPTVIELLPGVDLTLNEALLRAGDFTEFGDDKKVNLTRMQNGRPVTSIHNIQEVRKRGQIQDDVKLRDGDHIHVPKKFINL